MTTAQIQVRRGTASNWTSTNPTLAAGEIGFETDTGKFKIGKGSVAWSFLPYATEGTANYSTTAGTSTYSNRSGTATFAHTAGTASVAAYAVTAGTVSASDLVGSSLGTNVIGSYLTSFGSNAVLNTPILRNPTIGTPTITGGTITNAMITGGTLSPTVLNATSLLVGGTAILSQADLGVSVASLDLLTGKLTAAQVPDIALTQTYSVADETAMLELTAQMGDIALRTDVSKTFILQGTVASNLANWAEILAPSALVKSVDGQTGTVSLVDKYVGTAYILSTAAPLQGGGNFTTARTISISTASTTTIGAVQLTDSVTSTSTTTAATPNSVKQAYDAGTSSIPKTRTLTASSPITLDGVSGASLDLSANRTIGVNTASLSAVGVVQLEDSVTSSLTTRAATSNSARLAYNLAGSAVPGTRSITTTSPLSGGGTLSSNLTLSVGTASTVAIGVVQLTDSISSTSTTTAATPNSVKTAYDLATAANGVNTRVITTTSPLQGGGTLSSNLTLSIDDATTSTKGVVQLEDSTSSTSTIKAATPKSVKTAYDLAGTANAVANSAVPSTRTITTTSPLSGGGTLSSNLTISVDDATISSKGVVQLEDSTSSTSTIKAATPNSVKTAYDLADAAIPQTQLGVALGVATLDIDGLVPASQLPPAFDPPQTFVANSEAEMLALTTAITGDLAIRTDLNATFILSGTDPTVLADWTELLLATAKVLSVDGRIGTVTLTDLYDPYGAAGTAEINAIAAAGSLAIAAAGTAQVNAITAAGSLAATAQSNAIAAAGSLAYTAQVNAIAAAGSLAYTAQTVAISTTTSRIIAMGIVFGG